MTQMSLRSWQTPTSRSRLVDADGRPRRRRHEDVPHQGPTTQAPGAVIAEDGLTIDGDRLRGGQRRWRRQNVCVATTKHDDNTISVEGSRQIEGCHRSRLSSSATYFRSHTGPTSRTNYSVGSGDQWKGHDGIRCPWQVRAAVPHPRCRRGRLLAESV